MALDIDFFQKQLEEEKQKLENDLATVGQRNPDAPEDWEATKPDFNIMAAEKGEVADVEEEFENRISIEASLEERLREVNAALEKIKQGTYGFCSADSRQIEEERLRANPAASTCIAHAQ